MTYTVKELFLTLQGEGAQAGRRAVFLRFSGCNLWTGREEDRATAQCQFCDTDFVGTGPDGGKFSSADALAEEVARCWGEEIAYRYVVITGGEPLLQLDTPLINALHRHGFSIAIESNGTIAAPEGIDWICISPKAGTKIVQTSGDELKLVYPQIGSDPANFTGWNFKHFFLQPLDNALRDKNTQSAIDYTLRHPQWRLCLQTHKLAGLR